MSFQLKNLLRIAVLGIIIGFLSQCTLVEEDEPLFDNPLDPDDPNFIPPETFIIESPEESAVLDTHSVSFTWTGNVGVVEYSYRLNESNWSDWSEDTLITFTYLDEGDYTFEVKGRYHEQAEDETPELRSFQIDDIHGPALMFEPRKAIPYRGSLFSIDLLAEEVTDLMAVYAEIQYDTRSLRFDGYSVFNSDGDFLRSNNGTVVDIIQEDPATGILQVNLGVAMGNPAGVDGTGAMVRLEFTPLKTGTTEITLSPNCTMVRSNLDEMAISELVKGIVDVR